MKGLSVQWGAGGWVHGHQNWTGAAGAVVSEQRSQIKAPRWNSFDVEQLQRELRGVQTSGSEGCLLDQNQLKGCFWFFQLAANCRCLAGCSLLFSSCTSNYPNHTNQTQIKGVGILLV